ncbi:MAG: RCC1 domain-containing protein [Acidobacteriota bacterium]
MRLHFLVACAGILGVAGCYHTGAYSCESSVECVQNGIHGTCEPQGYCAFPDMSCMTGNRFENNAGMGLAGTCVPAGALTDAGMDAAIDAPSSCGGVGQQCCQGELQMCNDNSFCNNGTCQQCAIDIAIGNRHTCVLRYDGTVWCAGANDEGQLGDGTVGGSDLPMRQQVRDNTTAFISDATAIHSGVAHTCVLRAGGAVWCWGKNDDGQLGDGTSSNNRSSAVSATRASDGSPLTGFTALTATHDTTCGIDSGGGEQCWGDNALGQVGDGTTTTPRLRAVPVLVAAAGAPVTGIAQISGNDDSHNCYRTTANQIFCWGRNTSGEVGDNTVVNKLSPVHVFDAAQLVAGHDHTCAVKADGSAWCWGSGGRGRLGDGPDQGDQLVATPVLSSIGGAPFTGVAEMTAGGVSCSRMQNGDAYCWGTNQHGQTGTGIGTYVPLPVMTQYGTPLHGVAKLVAGYATVCAFLADGELMCWGRNQEGQLGDGTFQSRNVAAPVKVSCP